MRDKRGFTLIELLSVLVILGIISTIGVAGYNLYIKKSTDTYYDDLVDVFKTSAKDYFSDNIKRLPQKVGEVEVISSASLLADNYLESLVDVNKNQCTGEGFVIKKSSSKYDYKACITCGDKKFGDGCDLLKENDYKYDIITDLVDKYPQGKDKDGNYGKATIEVPTAKIKSGDELLDFDLYPTPKTFSTFVPDGTEYIIYYQYQNEYITKKVTIVDDTAPKISVSLRYADGDEESYNGNITNRNIVGEVIATDWTIEDELMGSGIAKIQYSFGNTNEWYDMEKETSGNETIGSILFKDHTYYTNKEVVRFRAVDNEGNLSTVVPYSVLIDLESPVIENTTNLESSLDKDNNTTNFVLQLDATDEHSGVDNVCISMVDYGKCSEEDKNSKSVSNISKREYSEEFSWVINNEDLDDETVFFVRVEDEAGNVKKQKYIASNNTDNEENNPTEGTEDDTKVCTGGLKCADYTSGQKVSYAGYEWYVLADYGKSTVLMLASNSHNKQKFGDTSDWLTSNAKSKVEAWFEKQSELVKEKNNGNLLTFKKYGGGYVRIPLKWEAEGIKNESDTPYWTMSASGDKVWYLKKNGNASYKYYTVSTSSNVACYYGYKISKIDSMKRYNQSMKEFEGDTLVSPNTDSYYVNWTFTKKTNPCSKYVADSSGKGPNSGHFGKGPFADSGPFCADSSPYYGDCKMKTGTNFCPMGNGDLSLCNSNYTTYDVKKNTEAIGLRPVIYVKEECCD